jgi:hypothetical protein
MAVIITSQPNPFSLVYNDNPYTFYSTNYTPTQRFVVYVVPQGYILNDPPLATVRVYPRYDSNGGVNKTYFDPSRILQSLMSSDIAIPGNNHDAFFTCPNSHFEYQLYIFEEDIDASGVYVRGSAAVTELTSVWNGIKDVVDWVDFTYLLYVLGASYNRFLTEAPRTQYVNSESYFLHYIATSFNSGKEYTLNVYDENDALTFTSLISINATYFPTVYNYNRIAVGPYDIVNIAPARSSTAGIGSSLTGASYYTIQMSNGASLKSEKFTFIIDRRCTKYEPIRLHWLNRLGGYDSFNFNYKSEVKTGVKRANYVQQHHTFTGDGWEYSKASRGTTRYDTQSTKEIQINTGYLSDAESLWMEDLFTSPVVYQELNNKLIAISIDGKSIDRQTSLNDKLVQYTFDLEYAITNTRQRG